MDKPTRAYGRVFYFGKRKDEMRKRALAGMALGGIDPEWDDLASAEDEISEPTMRHPDGHGPARAADRAIRDSRLIPGEGRK